MKKHIPNMITGCNLLSGAVATLFATQGAFQWAFACICLGALFDFFDGMVARKLGVSGPLGIQMDSLADDITFGLAPAMMVCCYLQPMIGAWAYLALLMAAFSALRLAKFNIDTRQTTSFIGLATPANALFWGGICSMPFFPETQATGVVCYPEAPAAVVTTILPWVLLALTFVSCWLLVSEIPFFSLKFKDLGWKNNSIRYTFLLGDVLLIAFCIFEAMRFGKTEFILFAGTACIVWYVCLNLLSLAAQRK